MEFSVHVLSMNVLLLCWPLCKRCTSVQGQVLANGCDKLTSCELVEQRSKQRTTPKKEEFCVDKYKKMLLIILMKAFCPMDLAPTTLCWYKRIIEFYFEFCSVQNFKAFFWTLFFFKSVYAITQNLLDQSFWNFAQYFFT